MTSLITDSSGSNIFQGSDFPATNAITWNLDLNRAARAHGTDRLTCPTTQNNTPGGSQHNDCNGTTFQTRWDTFYNGGGGGGEIYWEYEGWDSGSVSELTWPFYAVSGWICDGLMYSNGNVIQCATDSNAGHRSNIMTVGSEVGCGVVFGSGTAINTCDEGGGKFYSNKITSGAHIFIHPSATTYQYFVNYYDSSNYPVNSAAVIIDGVNTPLTLESGSATSGTYQSDAINVGSSCHNYHFEFYYQASNGSTLERFPVVGSFNTFGEGSCTKDFASVSTTVFGTFNLILILIITIILFH